MDDMNDFDEDRDSFSGGALVVAVGAILFALCILAIAFLA